MSTVSAGRKYTPEELLHLPDRDRFELVDGELVKKNMSFWSSYVGGQMFARLNQHCQPRKLGWVVGEGATYQRFPDDPSKVRKADVSFIELSRMSLAEATQEGHCPIAPDLAVEVISPNDVKNEVDRKVREYISASTKLVWVINPDVKRIEIHRADGTGTILTEKDTLSGKSVIPGFVCPVSELFNPPQA